MRLLFINKEIRQPSTDMEYKIPPPSYYTLYTFSSKKFCFLILDSFFFSTPKVYEKRERVTNISWTERWSVIDVTCSGRYTSLYSAYSVLKWNAGFKEYGVGNKKKCIYREKFLLSILVLSRKQ